MEGLDKSCTCFAIAQGMLPCQPILRTKLANIALFVTMAFCHAQQALLCAQLAQWVAHLCVSVIARQ